MSIVRAQWQRFKLACKDGESLLDQWVLRNPVAVWRRAKFMGNHKRLYSPFWSRFMVIGKCFVLSYIVANVFARDQNEGSMYDQQWKIHTEYLLLSNYIELQKLQQYGMDKHLRSLFARGYKKGLSQVELFELSKVHEHQESAKPLGYHVDYLRTLKS